MQFRTIVNIDPSNIQLDHKQKITCLGSCFAEHIGSKLNQRKFDILCNPNGIMYNPVSLSKIVYRAINKELITEDELFLQQDRWVHFDFHSILSQTDKTETLNLINQSILQLHDFLLHSKVLIISLGTSFVFKNKADQTIVNNCHKLPSENFERKILPYEQLKSVLFEMYIILKEFNKSIEIIHTVSPIRHLRDGLVENQRSKSSLHLALQELNESFDYLYYFPSYELLLDDLRDYRFYKKDMVHPSEQAVDYIWGVFSETFFNNETKTLNHQLQSIINGFQHRPFNPDSKDHQKFKTSMIKKITLLWKDYPHLDLKSELDYFLK